MKTRKTLREWEAVGHPHSTNVIANRCTMIAAATNAVLCGNERMLVVTSPSGVGKSFIVRDKLHNPLIANPTNYHELLTAFDSAGRKRPILLEEGDFCFRSERVLNILKIAADPVDRNRTYADRRLDAPVFILCNADLSTPYKSKFPQHLEALFRRSAPIIIPNDREMLWEYACYLAIACRMLMKTERGQKIPRGVADEALDFFTRNIWRLKNVSPATLVEIARVMTVYTDPYRRQRLDQLLGEQYANRPVPASPDILGGLQ